MEKTWKQIAVALYQILDDIDTADDMFKEDIAGFHKFVMKKQAEKNQYLFSDGFTVSRVEVLRESYEK